MKIADMTEDEQHALAGLVRWMLQVDGRISTEERTHLDVIAEQLGTEQFWALLDMAEREPLDVEALRACASRVLRKPAQETIYGALLDIAIAGTIVSSESEVLDWLIGFWGLELQDGPYR